MKGRYPQDLQNKVVDGEEFYCLTMDLVDSQSKMHKHSIWLSSVEG